jgi:flagellar basal-body rod protein FlgG
MLTLSYEYDANKIVVDLVRRMTTSKDDAERAAHVLAASVDDTHPLAQALKAIRTAMDVCANNIANANTTGFKRQRANFADTFYQRGESGDVPRGTGVKYVFYSQDFRQGPLEITGRSLDWAIEGEGYFCLDRGNGIRVYSRAGSFLRSRDGDIITSNGSRLDPPITIPENITDVSITMDGRVLGLDPSLPQQ